jgi:hypothetical protein
MHCVSTAIPPAINQYVTHDKEIGYSEQSLNAICRDSTVADELWAKSEAWVAGR